MAALCGAMLCGQAAQGYETDQLTDRDRPLRDAGPAADAQVDALLAGAIAATNRRTGCRLDRETTRYVLAQEIHRATAAPALARTRDGFRELGFGRYSAWLESGAVDLRPFRRRQDIFGGLSLLQAPILWLVGPSSTIRLNRVWLGTDKLHHFFAEGYKYLLHSRGGRNPDAALEWGTRAERTYYGMISSSAFSFADLKANYDGFLFYRALLEPGSVVQQGPDGCVRQVRPWHWARWIDWEYDEVLNPSVYTEAAQQGITRRLRVERDQICRSYGRWGGPDYVRHLDQVLKTVPPYVRGASPRRTDPFHLETLCRGEGSGVRSLPQDLRWVPKHATVLEPLASGRRDPM